MNLAHVSLGYRQQGNDAIALSALHQKIYILRNYRKGTKIKLRSDAAARSLAKEARLNSWEERYTYLNLTGIYYTDYAFAASRFDLLHGLSENRE